MLLSESMAPATQSAAALPVLADERLSGLEQRVNELSDAKERLERQVIRRLSGSATIMRGYLAQVDSEVGPDPVPGPFLHWTANGQRCEVSRALANPDRGPELRFEEQGEAVTGRRIEAGEDRLPSRLG